MVSPNCLNGKLTLIENFDSAFLNYRNLKRKWISSGRVGGMTRFVIDNVKRCFLTRSPNQFWCWTVLKRLYLDEKRNAKLFHSSLVASNMAGQGWKESNVQSWLPRIFELGMQCFVTFRCTCPSFCSFVKFPPLVGGCLKLSPAMYASTGACIYREREFEREKCNA